MIDNLLAYINDDAPFLVYALLILAGALVTNRLIHWLLNKLAKHVPVVEAPWRHALLTSPDAPIRIIIWLIAFNWVLSLESLAQFLPSFLTHFPLVRDVIFILVVAWWLFRLVKRSKNNLIARAASKGEKLDATAVDAISKLCWIAIWIVCALTLVQRLGFSITGVLAFGGAAGIAIGFAAQSLVANLFGGLTIFATRLFRIGDMIILPEKNLEGTVEHIGWRATTVRGYDRMPFYVPNSVFNASTVTNLSRMTNRRIMETISIRYHDTAKVAAIVQAVNDMLAKHPDIDHNYFVFRLAGYTDKAMSLFLYAFTDTDYRIYMRVKEDVLLTIANIIEAHGGTLAVPITQLQVTTDEPVLAGLTQPDTIEQSDES